MEFQLNLVVQKLFGNKRGRGEANKFSSIIYHCFICNSIKHKIYDYPCKDAAQAMFREKVVTTTSKKDDVAINMVSIVTTCSQIPKTVVFKEKEPFENKSLADWEKEERLQHSFEKIIKDI